MTDLSNKVEVNEAAMLSAKEHSKRAKRNKNVCKTPDRLWSMLHGKKGDRDKFLKIEAIKEEENSTSDLESVVTPTTMSSKPSFNLQLPRGQRMTARPQ